MDKLAIVIPAFKKKFFDKTLESFSQQTCKDFTIYIGDDASTEDLEGIVRKYDSHLHIVYHKFESNLGSTDLVSHWERCIDLVKDEQWIWFFSDDDVASPDCIEGFFETIKTYNGNNIYNKVFRFTLNITDQELYTVSKYETPAIFSVEYFLQNYFITHEFTNRVIEFIFSRSLYNEKGKFVKFPLAWGSDLATFLKFGQQAGFISIIRGEVFWRSSGDNISGSIDHSYETNKIDAYTQCFLWLFDFVQGYSNSRFYYPILYRTMHHINTNQALSILKKQNTNNFKPHFIIIISAVFIKLKRLFKYERKLLSNLFRKSDSGNGMKAGLNVQN